MKKIDGNAKTFFGKRILIAGIVCVTAALAIFAYNKAMDYNAGAFTDSVIREIKNDELKTKNKTLKSKDEKSAFLKKGYNFIGYLEIPKLKLTLPVMADWNYDKLNISPCRYSGSLLTDDLVIAAHNYSSHFGNIYRLEKGDKVNFTDSSGNMYSYEVVLTDTLNPVEINKMTSGEYALSLFTCNWTGTARVTVRCNRKY